MKPITLLSISLFLIILLCAAECGFLAHRKYFVVSIYNSSSNILGVFFNNNCINNKVFNDLCLVEHIQPQKEAYNEFFHDPRMIIGMMYFPNMV